MMKVKDLIEQLQNEDPEMLVLSGSLSPYHGQPTRPLLDVFPGKNRPDYFEAVKKKLEGRYGDFDKFLLL